MSLWHILIDIATLKFQSAYTSIPMPTLTITNPVLILYNYSSQIVNCKL